MTPNKYAALIFSLIEKTIVTMGAASAHYESKDGARRLVEKIQRRQTNGGKVILVGNGGSAAIASHVMIDLLKRNIPALTLSDAAALTAMANDNGYGCVFSEQLYILGKMEDLLIAISSSGKSDNILRTCDIANSKGMEIVTFSGFGPENELRTHGDVNFYVPSSEYGFVELAHHIILHAVTDVICARKGQ